MLHIVACIKQVPDTKIIKMNPKTNTMDRSSAPAILNPYDAHAVEEAVRLRNRYGGVVSVLTMGPPPAVKAIRKCIEIGADDGVNSNCANWYFHFGFSGLFLDGNPKSIARGEKFYRTHPVPWDFPPKFICSKVTRENINQLVSQAGLKGEISLLSIDIDGNDYWVWDALEVVRPNVVIIETHNEFGMEDIVVPYDPEYFYPGKHPVYHGASPVAMVNLARHKGYRLVGANYYGTNFIFVKNGLGETLIPEVSVDSVLAHPSVKESYKLFEPVKDWEYIRDRKF